MVEPALLPEKLRRQVLDELDAALGRIRQWHAGEAGAGPLRIVHRAFQHRHVADVEPGTAQARQVGLGILGGERQDVHPRVAVEEAAQPVIRQGRVEDRQELQIAPAQHGAAIAGGQRLRRAAGAARGGLPGDGGQGEAQPLPLRPEGGAIAGADADMIEIRGGAVAFRSGGGDGQARVSYFGSSHSFGSAAASAYQRSINGWRRTASR